MNMTENFKIGVFAILIGFLGVACGTENGTDQAENGNGEQDIEAENNQAGENATASTQGSGELSPEGRPDGDGSLIDEEEETPIELDADGEVDLEEGEVGILSPQDFNEKRQESGVQIVDVRQPSDYRNSHIPDAINMDFTDISFFREVQKLNGDQEVLVYCNDGRLSPDAASLISVEGFPAVHILEGGLSNWENNELPVE